MLRPRTLLALTLVSAPIALAVHASVGGQDDARPRIFADLPGDARWDTISAASFAERCEGFAASGPGVTAEAFSDLVAEVAAGDGETPTRAAVLLGALVARGGERSGAAADALLAALEERAEAGSRERVGRAVVAARALADRAAGDADLRGRLAALARGDAPHPDLPVRVECAAALARAGHVDLVLDFLLSVVRAETPDQEKSPRTWPRVTTLAWPKTRAAEALTAAAGTDLRYHPDAPWAHQMREADRLEALLR